MEGEGGRGEGGREGWREGMMEGWREGGREGDVGTNSFAHPTTSPHSP